MNTRHDKQFRVVAKAGGKPDETTLGLINAYALDPLSADDVVVREYVLAHNAIDRDREILDVSLLKDINETLPGKGVFIRHPTSYDGNSGPGEGMVYATRLETMSHDEARKILGEPDLKWAEADTTATLLYANVYYVPTTENEPLLKKIAAGIARFVSLGFGNADQSPVLDGAGNNIATRLLPPGQAYEMSLVWLGAQQGAHATKGADKDKPLNEGKTMNLEQKISDLESSLETANTKLATMQKAVDIVAKIRKALGLDEGQDLDVEALVAQAEDGKAYKDELVERVIKAQRLVGAVGDTDEDAATAKSAIAGMPTTQLKAMAENLEKTVGKGARINGGDTGTGTSTEPAPSSKGAELDEPPALV